jgi:hypothetical protein
MPKSLQSAKGPKVQTWKVQNWRMQNWSGPARICRHRSRILETKR